MPWAIALGALSSGLGMTPVQPLMSTIALLADAASPVALFTIGAVLARSQVVATAGEHAPLPARDFVPVAIAKLVVHPVLVFAVGSGAIAFGLGLDRFALTVMVLVAALPSASNVSLLAERFGADNGRIARIILLTTAAAFLSFSGAVALLR
jgi:malonate transporter